MPSSGAGHRAAAGSGPVMAQVAPVTVAKQGAPSQIRSAAAAAPNAPTVISHAPSTPARLALSNNNGFIAYSGVVGDDAARTAITDSLKSVFGTDKISGDLRVDQSAGPANWSKDPRRRSMLSRRRARERCSKEIPFVSEERFLRQNATGSSVL